MKKTRIILLPITYILETISIYLLALFILFFIVLEFLKIYTYPLQRLMSIHKYLSEMFHDFDWYLEGWVKDEKIKAKENTMVNTTCNWQYKKKTEHATYPNHYRVGRTKCNNDIIFGEYTPTQHNFKYCPYCGGEFEVVVHKG